MVNSRGLNGKNKIKQVFASQTGAANYQSASRPTFTFRNLKTINTITDVKLYAEGYILEPVSVSGNVVTFKALWAPSHTHVFTGDALATHQHDITTVGPAGGGAAMTQKAAAPRTRLETAGAGQTNSNAVDAKTGGTPTGTNTAQTRAAFAEITNGTSLATVTLYGTAFGW